MREEYPMSQPSGSSEFTRLQNVGMLVFVLLCGVPALEMNGFGFGLSLTFPMALGCATLGGAVGGILLCPRPLAAGLIGGLLAGTLGLLAVHYYTQQRTSVTNVELAIVQLLASLPGFGIGWLLKRAMSGPGSESKPDTPSQYSEEGSRRRAA
jgi:Na+/proline symporter